LTDPSSAPGLQLPDSQQLSGSLQPSPRDRSKRRVRQVLVRTSSENLSGFLTIPSSPLGLVLFAHGSGSSRHSPRNRAVAQVLVESGFATLLFDLLTPAEDASGPLSCSHRLNLDLLSERLVGAIDWLSSLPNFDQLPLGLFGASTGAAACFKAAVERPARVCAIVSRGGRPDLAFDVLAEVQSPTLLIVGSQDVDVLELNAWAASFLQTTHALQVIPGSGHLFQEPGCLEQAACSARDWFLAQMPLAQHGTSPPVPFSEFA